MSILLESYPLPLVPFGTEIMGNNTLVFRFVRADGADRLLTFAQLSSRADLLDLFNGDETWLRLMFPQKKFFRGAPADAVFRVTGFDAAAAADYLATRVLRTDLQNQRATEEWLRKPDAPARPAGDQS
nr:hypothetical protein [uncultured Rhodopila sp.]